MFDSKWKPTAAKPILAGVPFAAPSQKTIDRAVSIYYIMIGSLASVTQTSIKDLLDELRKRKDLFKHNLKFRIKEAFSRSEQLINVFKKYTTNIDQYQLWLDVTDSMEESLRADVNILFYTTDNILLKHNAPEHKLQTMTIVAYNLSVMLHDLSIRCDEVMVKQGFYAPGVKPTQEYLNLMYGMFASMREVADILVKDSYSEYLKEGGQIYKALEMIALKVCDLNRIELASSEGLKLNGVDYDGENNQDNSFAEWNGIQESFIRQNYNTLSDEDMAKMLGRTPGAVKARMRKLNLKRT